MKNNKLITLLRSFSKIELTQFKKYLLSPFFNENKILIELYVYIQKQLLKQTTDALINKQAVWKFLFKDKPYRDIQINSI